MKLFDQGIFLAAALLCGIISASAQSTDQNYPTPITSTEINGAIAARDIGDSRLTTYYYQFEGGPGDLFLNIVTRNFTGDIDLFILSGQRPLTKIVVYADFGENETGRVIYLRKPEKLMLRVQGRTPGDDAATFRVKFAGTFAASTATPVAEPELPSLVAKNESGIRVNSVGTIVEIIPKSTPTPVPAATETSETPDSTETAEVKRDENAAEIPEKKLEVVVTENVPASKPTTRRPPPSGIPTLTNRRRTTRPRTPPATRPSRGTLPAAKPPETKVPDPLEKVNLVILFKDGNRIERPMSQVLRFTVDKGVLTVIAKDGSIGRYSILDVAKVTIE